MNETGNDQTGVDARLEEILRASVRRTLEESMRLVLDEVAAARRERKGQTALAAALERISNLESRLDLVAEEARIARDQHAALSELALALEETRTRQASVAQTLEHLADGLSSTTSDVAAIAARLDETLPLLAERTGALESRLNDVVDTAHFLEAVARRDAEIASLVERVGKGEADIEAVDRDVRALVEDLTASRATPNAALEGRLDAVAVDLEAMAIELAQLSSTTKLVQRQKSRLDDLEEAIAALELRFETSARRAILGGADRGNVAATTKTAAEGPNASEPAVSGARSGDEAENTSDATTDEAEVESLAAHASGTQASDVRATGVDSTDVVPGADEERKEELVDEPLALAASSAEAVVAEADDAPAGPSAADGEHRPAEHEVGLEAEIEVPLDDATTKGDETHGIEVPGIEVPVAEAPASEVAEEDDATTESEHVVDVPQEDPVFVSDPSDDEVDARLDADEGEGSAPLSARILAVDAQALRSFLAPVPAEYDEDDADPSVVLAAITADTDISALAPRLTGAHARGNRVVVWDRRDPTAGVADAATRACDLVVTADPARAARFQDEAPQTRAIRIVHPLSPIAFHPIGSDAATHDLGHIGAPPSDKEALAFLAALVPCGLVVHEREGVAADRWPEPIAERLASRIPDELGGPMLRRYRVLVDPEPRLETVLPALACGGVLVCARSADLALLPEDLVCVASDPEEARAHVERLLGDEAERAARRVRGIRHVLSAHHPHVVLDAVCDEIGVLRQERPDETVSVVARIRDEDELVALLEALSAQTVSPDRVLLAGDLGASAEGMARILLGADIDIVRVPCEPGAVLESLSGCTGHVAFLDGSCSYGAAYLEDVRNGFRFYPGPYLGKKSRFEAGALVDPGFEYAMVDTVAAGTLAIRAAALDADCVGRALSGETIGGLRFLSMHRFSFAARRSGDADAHALSI